LPAQQVDFGGLAALVLLVEEADALGNEFVFVVHQYVTRQLDVPVPPASEFRVLSLESAIPKVFLLFFTFSPI